MRMKHYDLFGENAAERLYGIIFEYLPECLLNDAEEYARERGWEVTEHFYIGTSEYFPDMHSVKCCARI